mgnify:CR=1 FL=1
MIKTSTVQCVDELHFTGGLRGRRKSGEWTIGPLPKDGVAIEIGPFPESQITKVASELGVRAFGADEIILDDPHLLTRVWEPFVGLKPLPGLPTELWGNIAHHASRAGDENYATLARYITVCLRAADIRLRDISDGYGAQLLSALVNGTKVGHRFENIPLADLHLAIHSLVAEMGAARDYLAALVGHQLGAPSTKDSLARLIDWLSADARSEEAKDPAARLLMAGWNDETDPWLKQLTGYRNLFLHRGPMGARGIESAPRLEAFASPYGEVRTLILPIPRSSESEHTVDALTQFVRLHWQMFRLAADLAGRASYPMHSVVVTSDDIIGPD